MNTTWIFFALMITGDTSKTEPMLDAISRGDTTLTPEGIAESALSAAPEIKEARLRTSAARAQRRKTQLGLLPQIQTSLDASRLEFEEPPPGSSAIAFNIPQNRVSLRAALSYSLTGLLLDVLPRIGAESARVEARRAEEKTARRDLSLRARETFWRMVRARGILWVAKSSLREATASRDRLRSLRGAGLATPADLASGEARFEERREELLAAESDWEVPREDLELLIDQDLPKRVGVPRASLRRDRSAARAATGPSLAVSAFPRYVPV